MCSPSSRGLFIRNRKVIAAIGSSAIPKTLVGTANHTVVFLLPHRNRKPSAPVSAGSVTPMMVRRLDPGRSKASHSA